MSTPSTDVKSVQEVVKDRLQGSVANLIPDEVWDKMVAQAVTALIEPPKKEYHHSEQQPSKLVQMISKELESIAAKSIAKALADDKWKVSPEGLGDQVVGDYISTLCQKHAKEMMDGYFQMMTERMVGGAVMHLQASVNSINHAMQNGNY